MTAAPTTYRESLFGTDTPALNPAAVHRRAATLMARDNWTREQLLAYQQQRVQETLQHAVMSSAYYRETIGHLVARQAPLEELPVLTKDQLVSNFDRIVTDSRLRLADIERHLAGEHAADLLFGQYRTCATGGTTGVRAVIVYDQTAWENTSANASRFLRAVEAAANARYIGIGAPTPQHLSYRIFEQMRAGRPEVPRLDVTMPISEVVSALNEFQPEVIATYPSFIRRLAEEQLDGRLKISTRRFCSVAERLMPDVRDLARQAWGATIFNRFAATETGAGGSECEHFSGIHLPEDLVAFESVDQANRRVASGTPGCKLLITTLTNAVLPLIRYELSDIVTLAEGGCACGRPYARMTSIDGRREEVLHLPHRSGGRIEVDPFRLLSPLIGMAGIRQYQLVPSANNLTFKISVRKGEPREDIPAAVERHVRAVLAELDVADTAVAVEIVDALVRAGTGAKLKLVAKPAPNIDLD